MVYTSEAATSAAARVALTLADRLTLPVTLVAFQRRESPSADPAQATADSRKALLERLRADGRSVTSRVLVCRRIRQAIPVAFSPHSLVVIGGHRSWLPTSTERLRRALEAAGHYVVFVDRSTVRAHTSPVAC